MSTTINGTTGIIFSDSSTQNTAATNFGFKNRIINGAMVINQRGTGAQVPLTGGTYLTDRWYFSASVGTYYNAVQSSSTPPTGFTNYLTFTSTGANTPASGTFHGMMQKIEGFNVSDLGWGTANAQAVTLSFQVRSSLTGTFSGSIINGSSTRSYPFTYSVSAANTWTSISVTIPGDQSGTWATDNTVGLMLVFNMGTGSTYLGSANAWASANYYGVTGSVNVCATNGATFDFTGVQLEKSSTATSFDYRPYGTELALCQRYYTGNQFFVYASTFPALICNYKVSMRASPTISGGGAGFGVLASNTELVQPYQDSTAIQTITSSSEL